MEPLPRADLTASDPAISTPFNDLLDDYVNLLPVQHGLSLIGDDYSTHSWSTNRDIFSQACQANQSACVPVLKAQFDSLSREWQKRDAQHKLTLRDVVVMSTMTDLCQLAGFMDMGYRCLPRDKRNMAAAASIGWNSLGYDHLFLAYQDIDLSERNQMRSWLEHEAKLPPAETERELKGLERDKGASERDAYSFELLDSLSGAFSQWLVILLQSITQSNHEGMLTAMSNLARLAAMQGQFESAEQWWQFSQTLITEHPELKEASLCLLQSQRFSIDAALARSTQTLFDGPLRVQLLIDHGCAFTAQSLQYALQVLKQQQPARALDTLQRAQAACERIDQCGYSRIKQINMLIAIVQGQPEIIRSEVQLWQTRLKHGELLSTERQIVWVLADQLRDAGDGADSAALYRALDEQIDLSRNQAVGSNPSDLASYDELKRMRVRSGLEQGDQILPMQSESLRGQSLLRRLRTQRWLKELVGVEDFEAKAELDRQLVAIANFRQVLKQSLSEASPFNSAVIQAMLLDIEDAENLQHETYLEKLAAKKQNAPWFSTSQALMLYKFSDESSPLDSPITALENNEAYLSWLRVPGGYVATLLAVTPRNLNHRVLPTQHSIMQKFIPFTVQDEKMLQLYRDLLQSGASVSRGGRRTLPLETDEHSLMLDGLPIWQQTDGSFMTSRTAPVGGRRIQNFGNLSDALFVKLLAPFAEQYQDARRLIISPDGTLAYLPFETLTRQGVSVLETVDIGYVQSLTVYAELKKRSAAKRRKSEPSLLSVADPQFGTSTPYSDNSGSDSLRRMRGVSWPQLPGTRKESAAITSLYRNNRKLLGAQASKTSLAKMQKQDTLKGFQILHFATHGYVDDERSALVLSHDQTPNSAYLMDLDIVDWNLDSDLVLLSACNTGIGHLQQGEGVVGLPYAFFMAGNINTLMSLWPVDDTGTAAFIPAFMQRIQQGEDHVTALNNIKRAFARGDYGQAMSNPRIWSAFVMYGIPIAR
jgi:CHAT domain-containing protein